MIYLAGDNDMSRAEERVIAKLEAVATNPNVQILVLYDGQMTNYTWRMHIQPDGAYTTDVNKWFLYELNTGSGRNLADFVTWGHDNYPARYYYLSIVDHGRGTTGLAWDDSSGGDYLAPAEVRNALESATGPGDWRIDVVQYDACLMGMVEHAYELRNVADYWVAFENLGWTALAYDSYVSLVDSRTVSPVRLAQGIARAYHESPRILSRPRNVAAIDLSHAVAARQAVDVLSETLREALPAERTGIAGARNGAQKFDSQDYNRLTIDDEYIDLYEFAALLTQSVDAPAVNAAAQGVMTAIKDRLVIAEYHMSGYEGYGETGNYWDLDGSHGVSIYFPYDWGARDYGRYVGDELFQFTADGQWNEFLRAFFSVRGLPPLHREDPPMPPLLEP